MRQVRVQADWSMAIGVLALLALGPGLGTPDSAPAQVPERGASAIIGEMELETVVEREAELAVRVRSADGTPLEGARVFWTVDESTAEARLGGGNPTPTDRDGLARQTVKLGRIPGIVVVTAELEAPGGAHPRGRSQGRRATFRFRIGEDRLEAGRTLAAPVE